MAKITPKRDGFYLVTQPNGKESLFHWILDDDGEIIGHVGPLVDGQLIESEELSTQHSTTENMVEQ